MADRNKVVATLTDLFNKYGYSGTSLAVISKKTKLGRGSLYHMFPRGKAQMLEAVLESIANEFEAEVIAPLENNDIDGMFAGLDKFYHSGERLSLTAMTTLDAKGGAFTAKITDHYDRWRGSLTKALLAAGVNRGVAASLSERTIAGVEGALVLSSAFNDRDALKRTNRTLQAQINEAIDAA